MLKATRDGFGAAILQAAETDPQLMVLSADLSSSLRLDDFKAAYPRQYLELGVSEQNMAGVAAGLAMIGKTVVVTSFAAFNPGRNWEQIRVSICEQNLNVKIVGSHAGLATGPDGATHQALEDIALMSVLPQMKVLTPADYQEAKEATLAMLVEPGPVYLRLSREPTAELALPGRFQLGQARLLRTGTAVTVVALGLMVEIALEAADELAAEGCRVRVLDLSTVKPLDQQTLLRAAQTTGAILVAQEQQTVGGAGSQIATYLSQVCPVPMAFIDTGDQFGQSGTPAELFAAYGLTKEAIKQKVRQLIQLKEKK